MSMEDIQYPPMGDIPWELDFGPATLCRLSGDLRLSADAGWSTNPDAAFAIAGLWDSFRATYLTILELPEVEHAF